MEPEKALQWLLDKYVETFLEMLADYYLGNYSKATLELIVLLLPLALLLFATLIFRSPSGSKSKGPLLTDKQWNELMTPKQNEKNGVIIPPFDLQQYENRLHPTQETAVLLPNSASPASENFCPPNLPDA